MTEDVPPAKQCLMCEARAVDPGAPTPLCETHLADVESDTEASATPDDHAEPSGREFYPAKLTDRSWWVNWVLAHRYDDGAVDWESKPTKQPIAPYRRGDARPVRWHFGLSGDAHPSTDFETVQDWNGLRLGAELHAPERVISDTVGLGIIIPPEQDARTITLLDWDDVRDPETGAIHSVAAEALRECDGYAEISQSGEGIHQFVFGEIPGGLKKFIRQIDTEPFVGDDLPQIEMYQSGRLCAMTGRHIEGCGDDVTEGQDLIDRLCWEYGTGQNKSTDTPTDPFAAERDTPESDQERATPNHATVGEALRDAAEFDGESPEEWDRKDGRSLSYEAVLRARERSDEFASVANWELIGYAAALGWRDGLDKEEVLTDLKNHPTPSYGYDDSRARSEVRSIYRKAENGNYQPPTRNTLVERGILPEDASSDTEPVAVLPPSVRDLTAAASGWDWRHTAETTQDTLSMDAARERTVAAITDAYESGDRVLIDALPTLGKTYGSIKAVAKTGEQVTVLTGRGNKEQYAQLRAVCDGFGLSHYTLPSFTRDCPTASGEFGEEWEDRVTDWYNRGATPQQIHKAAEYVLDEPLPCQEHDDHRCPYTAKWDFDPDEYDVLIGHYTHAYREEKVTTGRAVVLDEFPGGAYETTHTTGVQGAVSAWLQQHDAVPFADYTDLIENRDDESRRADALLWFEEQGVEPDEAHVFDSEQAQARTPLIVYGLLTADDLGNGVATASLPSGTFVRDRTTGKVSILQPPSLQYASGVVCLDGTPTKRLWEISVGERLNHRQVLSDAEREEYVRDALNLNLVRTSEYIKPYNSADHVNPESDAALLERIHDHHDERPSLITTATAEDEYDNTAVEDHVDKTKHYGNVLGSNAFKEKRVGAVIGSNHYGDYYLKKWGAYDGRTVERNGGKGDDLSYGGFGDTVLSHMREHETLQAAMRFGRDGNGAVVYVHTDTLPEWVPVAGEGRVVKTWSDGMRDVLAAIEDLGTATTAEIAAHERVSCSRRQVFDHLDTLRERGVLDREQDDRDGRRVLWQDDGIHRVNEHGAVELETVEYDDLDAEAVDELARSSIYTWDFTNRDADPDAERREPPQSPRPTTETGVSGSHTPD